MLYFCVHLEIEALDENISRWETTWFNFRILDLTVLIWWGTTSIRYECGGRNHDCAGRNSLFIIHLMNTNPREASPCTLNPFSCIPKSLFNS